MTRFIKYTCLLYMLSFTAYAIDYHVCSNGNDLNDGLSHNSAWKSYAKAQSTFGSLIGGDSILFCKGEEFIVGGGSTRWINFNSTGNNRVTISSYTPPSGNSENPTIYASAGGSVFRMEDGGDADHDEGYVISNLTLRGTGTSSGWAIFIYNDADFIDIHDVEIYDFSIGIHLSGSNTANAGSDGRNSDLRVSRVFIHDNSEQGFLGTGDNLLIEDSFFVNNGFDKAILNHNIYLSDHGASNEIIRNNKLYQSAMVGGMCSGVSLVAHGNHFNLLIENNVVWEDVGAVGGGCWGIAIDSGYSTFEQFPDLVIRGNTVVNVGNMSIGCSACPNAIIENNTIVHQAQGTRALMVPDRNESGNANSNNVTVRNNTVLYDSPGGGSGVELGDGDGSNYASLDNKVYYSSGSGMVSGCESYNGADSITSVNPVCEIGIPQDLLDAALAKTTVGLPTPSNPSTAANVNDDVGGSGSMGWIYLGFISLLFGLKIGLSRSTIKRFLIRFSIQTRRVITESGI